MPVHDPQKITNVVVHPLVLLSVVDHFNRMGKVGNVKRVVGVLLGANRRGVLDVSNSFAGKAKNGNSATPCENNKQFHNLTALVTDKCQNNSMRL